MKSGTNGSKCLSQSEFGQLLQASMQEEWMSHDESLSVFTCVHVMLIFSNS